MKRSDYNKFQQQQLESVKGLINTKGADYAGDDDVLANFKRIGGSVGLSPEKVWAIFAMKHWDAVMAYCREGQVESEPIETRLQDIIAYCLLMLAMVSEKEPKEATGHPWSEPEDKPELHTHFIKEACWCNDDVAGAQKAAEAYSFPRYCGCEWCERDDSED